jgi:hypothetical protein
MRETGHTRAKDFGTGPGEPTLIHLSFSCVITLLGDYPSGLAAADKPRGWTAAVPAPTTCISPITLGRPPGTDKKLQNRVFMEPSDQPVVGGFILN